MYNRDRKWGIMSIIALRQRLLEAGFSPEQVLSDEPMSRHTTFAIGGPADLFVMPGSEEQVRLIYQNAGEMPVTVLGNGSNLLVRDGGIRGVVMQLGRHYQNIQVQGRRIIAQAGASMRALGQTALAQHLTGVECLCGIPGSVGGALTMNAGAYGGQVSDHLQWAKVLDPHTGEIKTLGVDELAYGYRQSRVMDEGLVALEGCWELEEAEPEVIAAAMEDYARRRHEKQPLNWPSAGSVFKRPEGHFAGALIEEAGLKGCTVGGARVSELHAGFIINADHATARDVLDLVAHIRQTVYEKSGIWLEPEIRIMGED